MDMDSMDSLSNLLDDQHGVISRFQALELGVGDNDLRRLVRQRRLVPVHPGVHVNHSGTPTWLQQAMAAVLYAWPAALSHQSALRIANGPGRRGVDDGGPIHVAVRRDRTLSVPSGIVLHRLSDLSERTQWNRTPPRVRLDQATIDVAASATTRLEAIAVLTNAVSSRQTTAERLIAVIDQRARLRNRLFLVGVLRDIATGTCSVLEHGYLNEVERPHGLPRGLRQRPGLATPGRVWRDVLYPDQGLIVELDGQTHHGEVFDRDRDLARDVDAAIDLLRSVRLGWAQVFDTPCDTARKVGRLLQALGWRGSPVSCKACAVAA